MYRFASIFLVMILLAGFFEIRETSAQMYSIHLVKKDESLWKIAKKYLISLEFLIRANPLIKNPNLIYPEQEIFVPNIYNIKLKDQTK